MLLVRTPKVRYTASPLLNPLFREFKLMCNDPIRIALEYEKGNGGQKVRNRFHLIELAYPRLKQYGLHSQYILSACEVAFAVFRNKHRKRDPYVRKPFLKLYPQTYSLNHLILRISARPRQFIYIILQSSNYLSAFMADPSLKRGSVTITPESLNFAFSKEIEERQTLGNIGIDVNEKNLTWTDSSGLTRREDLAEIVDIQERYKFLRARIAEKTRQDRRTNRLLQIKYGRRERNRTTQRLHAISSRIVSHAKRENFGIVMENLKGIRKLYRKGNGQGSSFRGRMNSWMFHEIQRQTDYKARWEANPVYYVHPRGTSRKCPICGSFLVELEGRRLWCPKCKKSEDRDVIASKNILMAAPVCAARPPRRSDEVESRRQENAGNPQSGWEEVSFGE